MTLVEANHYGRSAEAPITLDNGLAFGIDRTRLLPTPYWGGEGQRTDTDSQTLAPALSSGTAYGALMRSYIWTSSSSTALNIPGLTPGHTYRMQLISSSSRNAGVAVEGNAAQTWTGTGNSIQSLLTAIWIQSPGDTEANIVFTRNGNELLFNGYALHDMTSLVPLVASISLSESDVKITFETEVNYCYTVEFIDSLPSTESNIWVGIPGSQPGTGSPESLTHVGATGNPQRFYRVKRVQGLCPP